MKIKGEGRVKPHLPQFTKWRKNKGQFKRKKNFHQTRKGK